MKSTIVPAQITTVEDKVAGNLSLSQLLLLAAPIFGGSAIYIVLPPSLNFAAYKIVLTVILALVFGAFAIRIKGRILLLWAIIVFNYALRPRYHIFNKNDPHLRNIEVKAEPEDVPAESQAVETATTEPAPSLSIADAVRLQEIIANPEAKLRFKTNKKGALNVYINEVK